MLRFKEQEYREVDEKVKNMIKQLEDNENSKKRKYKYFLFYSFYFFNHIFINII